MLRARHADGRDVRRPRARAPSSSGSPRRSRVGGGRPVREAASKSDLDRTVAKQKSGVATGVSVLHPLTGEESAVGRRLRARRLRLGRGDGGARARRRDHAAEAFGLPIKTVVAPAGGGDASSR